MNACMYGLLPDPRPVERHGKRIIGVPIIRPLGHHALKAKVAAPSKRGRHRQVMSASVKKVLAFLRTQQYPVFSLEVLHATKVPNTRISSIFQRLRERGYIERTGVSGRYRYKAVK